MVKIVRDLSRGLFQKSLRSFLVATIIQTKTDVTGDNDNDNTIYDDKVETCHVGRAL